MAWQQVDPFDFYTSATQANQGLWTGNSIVGVSSSMSFGTSYGRFGSGGFRCIADQGVSGSSQQAAFFWKYLPASRTTLFAGFAMYINVRYPDQGKIAWFNDGATNQLELRIDGVGHLLVTRNGTLLATSTNMLALNAYRRIEFKAVIDPVAGSYEVRVDGVSWLSASGVNTSATGSVNITQIMFGYQASGPSGGWAAELWFDDYMCWDDQGSPPNGFIGDCRVQTKFPTANGAQNNFTPSAGTNWQCVDETVPNDDTDYVSSSNPTDEDRYTHAGNVVGSLVIGVVSALRARKDDANVRSLRSVIKSGASEADSGSDFVQASTYQYYLSFFPTDPNTGLPWTVAAANAAEFGVKVTA